MEGGSPHNLSASRTHVQGAAADVPCLSNRISVSRLCFAHTFALAHSLIMHLLLLYRWIQIACPRLSIDWGTAFSKPLLSPYEVNTHPPSEITAVTLLSEEAHALRTRTQTFK